MKKILKTVLLLIGFCAVACRVQAQRINLDAPVRAGDLTLFPDVVNSNEYYYVSDKPKLATNANGLPKFSFLKYVDNTPAGSTSPANAEGGIVHAVVSLSVSQDQVREAQRALQRLKPNGVILGPVVYKSGKFGLVSSFKDPQAGLVRQVVGLTNAPLLDQQQAAVSIHLTRQGANILWESFHTAAPDISFTFEMEVTGYRAPKKAMIEADFDQIYDHHNFAAGIATRYLSAEIKAAFDDLVRSGAIKVTQVGEDEKMEALITTAYNKLTEMMFSPLNGSGAPGLGDLAGVGSQGPSLLDRATTMLRTNREEARSINRENETRRANTPPANGSGNGNSTTGTGSNGRQGSGSGSGPGNSSTTGSGSSPSSSSGSSTTTGTGSGSSEPASSSGTGATTSTGGSTGTTAGTGSGSGETTRPARSFSDTQPVDPGTHSSTARPDDRPATSTAPTTNQDVSVPEFAVLVTYEMKHVHQKGTFKIDLNKSTADNITLRFDENIGDMRPFLNDNSFFRQANVEDPLYTKREITAMVDGMNAQDFGQYVNSVNVRLVKRHQSGETTNQEVHIDRTNFNTEGNNFTMFYGWKGDNNRRNWMDYEYETEWSFFGGQTVKVPLQQTTSGVINLMPPYQRRSVEFQADAANLSTAGVRSIVVKLFYQLGGKELMKQVVLNPARAQLSEKIEFMLPADQFDYEYEVIWKMGNNENRSSGRIRGNDAIQFVDQVGA